MNVQEGSHDQWTDSAEKKLSVGFFSIFLNQVTSGFHSPTAGNLSNPEISRAKLRKHSKMITMHFSRLLEHQQRLLSSSFRRRLASFKNMWLLSSNFTWPQIYRRPKMGLSSRISCPQVTNISNVLQWKWFCLFRLKKNNSSHLEIWKKTMPLGTGCITDYCETSLPVSQEFKQMSFPFFFFL